MGRFKGNFGTGGVPLLGFLWEEVDEELVTGRTGLV